MEIQYFHDDESGTEEQHLAKLKACVQQVLADGKLSLADENRIWQFVQKDGKATVEELRAVQNTIREVLGNATLEFDW
ncbi:MAG TPA: hypothetical protein V6D29_15750 [Leptolyngbyaceae cyanobacterium]